VIGLTAASRLTDTMDRLASDKRSRLWLPFLAAGRSYDLGISQKGVVPMRSAADGKHSAPSRSPVPQSWVLWAGAVVIVAQLIAMGLVVSRHAEQAAARQAAVLKAPVSTASADVLAQK